MGGITISARKLYHFIRVNENIMQRPSNNKSIGLYSSRKWKSNQPNISPFYANIGIELILFSELTLIVANGREDTN